MSKRKKLGELLISEGLIDEIQLNSAIGHQRNWGGKLGSTLVELGFLKETDIARMLEGQLRQKCLEEDKLVPTREALDMISAQDAFKYDILPLKVDDKTLELAMSNPFDLQVVDELGFKLGKRIIGRLAVESSIKHAIKKYYFGEDTGKRYRGVVGAADDVPETMQVIPQDSMQAPPVVEHAPEVPSRQVQPSADVISKALAYLLIEKGIIKRDELIEKMKIINDKG